jgi:hypothetical protein
MLIVQAFITGLITSLLLTIIIPVSLAINPRLWISDFPKEMQEATTPLSPSEKRNRLLWAIPLMLVMFVYPIFSALQYENVNGAFSFVDAYVFFFVAWMTWNMWDLVIIDWFLVVWWQPEFIALPEEIAHLNHLNNYKFHLIQSLKGCVLIAVLSLIVGFFVQF